MTPKELNAAAEEYARKYTGDKLIVRIEAAYLNGAQSREPEIDRLRLALEMCRRQRDDANVFYCEKFNCSEEELTKSEDEAIDKVLKNLQH